MTKPHFFNRKLLIVAAILMFSMTPNQISAQTYLYFQDSPLSDYYDFSWMELTSPSELERTGSELRRFPVESVVAPVQGVNSLRLKWKSVNGGDWVAIAAGTDWTAKNISDTDTLLFWLQSAEGLSNADLPRIFMEDVSNIKTTKYDFAAWCSNLPAGLWTKVTIPMSLFLDAGDPVNFTQIKTIGFAQNNSDGIQHTLYIDDMRVFKGTGVAPPADVPTGVSASGYDSHIEIFWNPNNSSNLNGYEIQRSLDGGTTWSTIAVEEPASTSHIDWVRSLGTSVNAVYRVKALNTANEPSAPSDPATATTRIFSDEELLDMVQQYTFRYFYDFAHPVSGMARERNTSGDVVTTGGTGFGIMGLIAGVERGFITREEGVTHLTKIVSYLETADRFHGVWPHWLNGNTGQVVPFSTYDNGGDLVETGFLVQGLLAGRQYFNEDTPEEQALASRITALWETVEWDWYSRNNSGVLYWHWSPNYNWQINMQIRGWNEAAIIYMLAIASPTHPVPASYWNNGWAGASHYRNGGTFYGYKLDVGWDRGGPLFFAHYSFLGFDPRSRKDGFTNYFNLNRNHTLIHRAYCMQNPLNFTGYGDNCWGLTASDDPDGYMAHEPVSGRDNGTITPTAALSSMPYTPQESMGALKHFYRELGEKTWGSMGFYDAFNQKRNWWATSTLAIDQGPILVMIENYRSQAIWNSFMANPEIAPMLESIGFVYDANSIENKPTTAVFSVFPNPTANQSATLTTTAEAGTKIQVILTDIAGRETGQQEFTAEISGLQTIEIDLTGLKPGIYTIFFTTSEGKSGSGKLVIAGS
jgi:hypothetical protein